MDAIYEQVRLVKASIIAGNANEALTGLDQLLLMLQSDPPEASQVDVFEKHLDELRKLASAALSGARNAAEKMRGIIQASRSFETYDHRGQRQTSDTTATRPNRY